MKNGNRNIVYNEAEIQNIFTLYDLKGLGNISREQCRDGKYQLSTITIETHHHIFVTYHLMLTPLLFF